MKIAILESGSGGNAILVTSNSANIIVDVGISKKSMSTKLAAFGLSLDDISAILVTHSHSDHFSGLDSLLKKRKIPLFASEETASSIDYYCAQTKKNDGFSFQWNYIAPGNPFIFNNLSITPFEVPHDANGAVGYTIEGENSKIGIATDLGCVTNSIKYHLAGCDALVLEMNHDFDMLMDSDRPQMLKSRISGKLGHLSNNQAIEFLDELDTSRLKYLFPAHLSEECNDFSIVKSEILSLGKKVNFKIVKTCQNESTALIDLTVNNL